MLDVGCSSLVYQLEGDPQLRLSDVPTLPDQVLLDGSLNNYISFVPR